MTITERVSRVVVVTGAGSGLGRAMAIGLLDAGHHVVLAGRNRASLDATGASHERSVVIPADVSSPDSVHRLFASVSERFGRLDVLVNNAGTFGPSGSVDEIDPEAWNATVAANLTGVFLCAREAIRIMKTQDPRGGRIINNGSLSAHTPRPDSAAYTASKHGVSGLTKSISLDGREFDICCSQIDIGNAATDMTAGIGHSARQSDGTTKPEPTFDPRHVADTVVQLIDLPLDVNVPTLTIMANRMPYVGRG
ncbi:SDR family NAD(P)-dependent oxidoreductase [Rhodococcus sp. KBW08]|uniref:SDR family oxidoreductase n=2 Tax=Nocardiaceae TaxID=85025 RepID=UPI000BB34CE4|nr:MULTISPECIES: SDR family oxidoreductase [Rhodococcus]MBJ7476331.1 SDR family oxidoreductase [Rhodococcus sp. (in: high G+C Gram-positive bacteria)]PBJ01358.1 putative oxidoreductase [Rhodococcus erythropolis]QQM24001.1 SDR family oxidoreductase [Rhodococcus sp. P-2]RQO42236.1 SDR family NAD(P)-dependent oxidoreductase [Rhodococcus sp. KBW08]